MAISDRRFDYAFDDARTRIMGETCEAGRVRLHGVGYPDGVKGVIADRIIATAGRSPKTDPERLASAVVASPGIKL